MFVKENDLINALKELSPNGFKLWAFYCYIDNNRLYEEQLLNELLEDEEDCIYAYEELEYKGYLQNIEGVA